MNTAVILLLAAALTFCRGALAAQAQPPCGTLLELHSCELYAGGCVVSSEATQGGRYMLRVWKFSGGGFAGNDFAGLQMALLQTSTANLAEPHAAAEHSVVYLPADANETQRSALLAWLRSCEASDLGKLLDVRVVSLRMESRNAKVALSAGKFLKLKAGSLDSCPVGSCGEALWYNPRSSNTIFTVGQNESSTVLEPLLQLKWQDAAKKSVFLARFGEPSPARNVFVSLADICGPGGAIF